MDIGNPALNLGFAAEQAVRLAASIRGGEETIAVQLRQAAAESRLTVGTTITARYRYKVAEDGGLVPLQSQITTEAAEENLAVVADGGRRQRRALRGNAQGSPASFRDFIPPRPVLSPSDEASIFSALARSVLPSFAYGSFTPRVQTVASSAVAIAEASDETGSFVPAEIITPAAAPASDKATFSASYLRAQYSVANLYARTVVVANTLPSTLVIAA